MQIRGFRASIEASTVSRKPLLDWAIACHPRPSLPRVPARLSLGRASGKIGFHGGKIDVGGRRVHAPGGREVALPSWDSSGCDCQCPYPSRRRLHGNSLSICFD